MAFLKQSFQSFSRRFLSGLIVCSLTTTLTYPLEVFQTKNMLDLSLKSTEPKFRGFYNTISKVSLVEGFPSFYRGYFLTILSTAPYLGLSYAFYDSFRHFSSTRDTEMSFLSLLGLGGTAGLFAHILTYPLETIRRQLQACGPLVSCFGRGKSAREIFNNIKTNQGIRGLYSGLGASCLHAVVLSNAHFTIYHLTRKAIKGL
jgi:Mitochondrial carrier protein